MKSHQWRHRLLGILLGSIVMFSGTAFALDVGDKAPNFALPATTGKDIGLGDFAGKKAVVLFFYIGAFTNT